MPRGYPEGVPFRRRRPEDREIGGAVVGALLGAVIGGPWGAAIGGGAGLAAGETRKLPLDAALRADLLRRGIEVVSFQRPGRTRAIAMIQRGGEYFSIESRCRYASQLDQEDLDDWLFGDLADHQVARLFGGQP